MREFYFWLFWGSSIAFSTIALQIYIPSNSVEEFPSLLFLTSFCLQCLFGLSIELQLLFKNGGFFVNEVHVCVCVILNDGSIFYFLGMLSSQANTYQGEKNTCEWYYTVFWLLKYI